MSRPVVLVTGADLAEEAIEILNGFEIIYAGKSPQATNVLALCKQHNPTAIVLRYGGISAEMMDAAPNLRVISKHGSGTDSIDKLSAKERGIEVKAAIGANAAAVAEHALALMLACAKSTIYLNERMHAGYWDKATFKTLELSGKTVGIIGLGAIGQRFAKMCDAMEMKVIGYDPFASNIPAHLTPVALEAIWRDADVISFHCPLTSENSQMLNAETLALCKPGVIIINTARGGLIDELALLDAIAKGGVAMAALDSFATEPMTAPHHFQDNPKIILSPHIGGVSSTAYTNMGVGAANNILSALSAKS
jgi:D-3-phosphoglycerate dehydrogenase